MEIEGTHPQKIRRFGKRFFSEKVALDIGRNVKKTKKGKICNYLTRQKPTHNGSKFSTLDPFLDRKKKVIFLKHDFKIFIEVFSRNKNWSF
jgi:hypothetical protein